MKSALELEVNELMTSIISSLYKEDEEHILDASWLTNFDILNQEA